MMLHTALLTVVIAVTFFAAGAVKGITSMGLPTVAMGVLGAIVSPLTAAGLLLVPSFVTNAWQLLAGPDVRTVSWRLWPMMIAILAGTIAGSSVLANGGTGATTAALGIALIAYAVYTLTARQIQTPSRVERWMSPLVGLVTGVITGCT